MLTPNQLQEIKENLEASQNPLFFFDNDVDGLCAFLILRRAIGRGKGIAIKSFPDLKEQYVRKVEELNPDAIFILDKAELSKEFADAVEQKGIPMTWIDHHETKTPKEIIEKTSYFNTHKQSDPQAKRPTSEATHKRSDLGDEPVTYIAQKIFNRQEDLWLAVIGCIGDVYMPDFAEKFSEQYPELLPKNMEPFDALHSSEIGKMVRMLNFGLMDTITNVVNLIKYLFKANSPADLLEENQYTKQLHKRYSQLNEFYNKQVTKAETKFEKDSPVLFYTYAGNTSMSSEIANKLYHSHKDKLIIVAFKRPEKVNVSIRGETALETTKKLIANIEDATGGGHVEATGAMIPIDDFETFKENIKELNNNKP
jgi:oligoribonuclease NrnB/cAMP/cGMP phosphodiesterase (DHH superfamily)